MSKNNKGGRPPIFENSFKIAVARAYLTGEEGYGALAKKYGVTGEQVRRFVDWYRKHSAQVVAPDEQNVGEQDQVLASPAVLKELKEAKLKITALEMMIEIASKELGVDIRKKAGARQSKK